MFNNKAEKIIIPVQKGDYLEYTHYNPEGEITVETIARVQNIDHIRKMLTLRFPDNEHSNMNIVETPFMLPIVRGTVAFPSQHKMVDGTDFYSRIEATKVPDEIKCRLNHQP